MFVGDNKAGALGVWAEPHTVETQHALGSRRAWLAWQYVQFIMCLTLHVDNLCWHFNWDRILYDLHCALTLLKIVKLKV